MKFKIHLFFMDLAGVQIRQFHFSDFGCYLPENVLDN